MLVVSVLALCVGASPVGGETPGFPVPLGGDGFSSPAVADFIGDGALEIALAVDNVAAKDEPARGVVLLVDREGKSLPGWPQTIEGGLAGDCEVADWDRDGTEEVLVLDKAGSLHVLSGGADATVRPSSGTVATGFCSGDFVPGSRGLEAVVTSETEGTATLLDHSGDPLSGWPAAPQFVPGYLLWSRPALADVDGDGRTELSLGHTCYAVVGLRADGSQLQGFPLQDVGMAYPTPVRAHLTSDRHYDLIFTDVSSVRSLHSFALPYDSVAWQAHSPTPAEAARGFVLTAAVPFETILPDTPMVEGKLLDHLEVTACAEEYEPATFVIHALKDLDVVLRPADLVAGTGVSPVSRIPAVNLDLRFVHVWRQRRPDNPGEYRVPELLLKRDPGELKGIVSQPLTAEVTTHVPAGTARQFRVTVRAPDDAAPGTYAGSLALSAEGVTMAVPLSVRVMRLKLPPDPVVHCIYFHGSSIGLGWYGEKEMSADA